MNKMRRTLCQSMGGVLGLLSLNACSQPGPKQAARVYTEEEQQRLYKFRGVKGGEWYLSSVHDLRWIEIRNQDGRVVEAPAGVSPGSRSRFSLSSIPIRLKVIWREQDPNNPIYSGKRGEEWSGGKIIASFEIPVADRIPDALLDDLRRDPRGGLRIKIRLHREGVLLGWDIERRPRFDPKRAQEGQYYPPAYSHTGGDFKEARPASYLWEGDDLKGLPSDIPVWSKSLAKGAPFWRYQSFVSLPPTMTWPLSAADELLIQMNNLKIIHKGAIVTNPPTPLNQRRIWEKGWYIHPKTGQRIETDF